MVTRLSENVWWVDLQGTNAYLVEDDGVLTLVDAGFPWQRRRLVRAITTIGYAVADVERVLITHYDVDHVGALDRLQSLEAPVYIGREDAPYLTGEAKPPLTSRKGFLQRALDWWGTTPSLPIEPVDDGDTIGSFTVYHTPGHTAGHVVYASESLSVAFVGDAVRESAGRLKPVPRIICAEYETALESLERLAAELPRVEALCPGHGTPFGKHGSERLDECVTELAGRM